MSASTSLLGKTALSRYHRHSSWPHKCFQSEDNHSNAKRVLGLALANPGSVSTGTQHLPLESPHLRRLVLRAVLVDDLRLSVVLPLLWL